MTYRRLLRLAALPVTNRRWAAPLAAIALGFGLFVGVAIGPGASGTQATGASPILVEIPGPGRGASTEVGDGLGSKESLPDATASSAKTSTPPPLGPAFHGSAPVESAEADSPPASVPADPEPETVPQPEEKETDESQTLAGVVVHVNPAAGSYVLAEAGGALSAIHAGRPPAPGTEIEVPARPLANGTFAEAGRRVRTGNGGRATLSGIVTYVDATAAGYTLSKRGVSVLVRVRPDRDAPAALPALGALAEVEVSIGIPPPTAPAEAPAAPPVESLPGTAPVCARDPALPPPPSFAPSTVLWQRQLHSEGAPFTYADFEGVLAAVCPESGQLAISADDIRQGLRDLVFSVPAEIDTGDLVVGQSVAATATIGEDGSLTLSGLASDERIEGADDTTATRGDLAVEGDRR